MCAKVFKNHELPSFPELEGQWPSSQEADQDQDQRGEAVRSRERRSSLRLLFLASWRPERPGGAEARGGRRTQGLTWGSAAGGDWQGQGGRADAGARGLGTPLPQPLGSKSASNRGGGWRRPCSSAPAIREVEGGGLEWEGGPGLGPRPPVCARPASVF